MHLILSLLAPLLHLPAGTQLRIDLPKEMGRFAAQSLADNLVMGSLCHVATAKAGPKQQAQLVANFDGSTCFGREVAKAGDVGVAFDVPGTVDQRQAIAEAIRVGVHADKLSITVVEDAPAKPATIPPPPPPAPGGTAGAPPAPPAGTATQGQVPPPGK